MSQDLRGLQVGAATWSFVLQPTGKVDVLLRVWRTAEETFVLDTDAGFGDALVARLLRFKIRVKAEVVPLAWRCIAVRGAVADGGIASWGSGADLLGPSPEPPAGVPEGSADDLLAARVTAAWPAMGAEIVPGETIPAETGVIDLAVSFTKGCYPGQELVERMDSRAVTAPRVLRRMGAAEAASLGARVTSAHGDDVLAYVPRAALQH
jgi:folate-binding protein YgfZ